MSNGKPGWVAFEAEMTAALAAAREMREHLCKASSIVDEQARAGNTMEAFRDGQMHELYMLLNYLMARVRSERKHIREWYLRVKQREPVGSEA